MSLAQPDDAAGSRAGDAPESGRRDIRDRIVEIHLIECVEELTAQLQAHVRPEAHVPQDGEIRRGVSGP